jgi:hypothetical protein
VYIPKWVPISRAINHVRAIQGLNHPDAEHLLVLALRDEDVKARDADTGEPLASGRWWAVARNPVHMPSLIRIEICVDDVLRHWPERSDMGPKIEHHLDQTIVRSLVLAKKALSGTIAVLNEAVSLGRVDIHQSIREAIEDAMPLPDHATECLRTACAARNLSMLVIDPRSQLRHEVPAEYFDQRPFADLEFGSAYFRGCEKSELAATDPLFKLVLPFRGWVHGFIEDDFQKWLEDPDTGPLAGPTMRPFFHTSATSKADRSEDAATQGNAAPNQRNSDAKKGRIPTKRGALACWVAQNYSAGLPPGAKIIADDYLRATDIIVSVRSVRRALGGK